jgi:hypothetical protein
VPAVFGMTGIIRVMLKTFGSMLKSIRSMLRTFGSMLRIIRSMLINLFQYAKNHSQHAENYP